MKIVALVRPVESADIAARLLAEASGVALAEARMRLAPAPPALLARLAPEAADEVTARLRGAGLAVLAMDETAYQAAPRIVVRTFALEAEEGAFAARNGTPVQVPWGDIVAVLRGSSVVRTHSEVTSRHTRFSMGTAVLTGGLKLTKTVKDTEKSTQHETEQVVFLYTRDGRCLLFREHAVDFSCLGAAMQPVRLANMNLLARLLRQRAPHAFYDERLLRLGIRPLPFVVGSEQSISTANTVLKRSSTVSGLELAAEVMHQALREGLLP